MGSSPAVELINYTDDDTYWKDTIGFGGTSSYSSTIYFAVDSVR